MNRPNLEKVKKNVIVVLLFLLFLLTFLLSKTVEANLEFRRIGEPLPESPTQVVKVVDGYAYIGFEEVFVIADVSNPFEASEVSRIELPNAIEDILIADNFAFVTWFDGMWSIDIQDKFSPQFADSYNSESLHLEYREEILYITDLHNLKVIDAKEPNNLVELKTIELFPNTSSGILDIILRENNLYLSGNRPSRVWVFDVKEADQPYYQTTLEIGGANAIEVIGQIIYTGQTGCSSICLLFLSALDIQDLSDPKLVGQYVDQNLGLFDLEVFHNWMIVGAENDTYIVDISSPEDIKFVDKYTSFRTRDVEIHGGYLFLATYEGLEVHQILDFNLYLPAIFD